MFRQSTIALHNNESNTGCATTSCLKKIFTRAEKKADEAGYTVCSTINDARRELELLNKNSPIEMSFEYLKAMEETIPGAAPRYAVIYKRNIPVLFVWFQLFTITADNFKLSGDKGFIKSIVRFFLNLKKARLLVSGNALRNHSVAVCYNNEMLNEAEANEMVAAVAEKIAAEECATALILKDIPFNDKTIQSLIDIGYEQPWDDNVMVMPLQSEWTNIADYINSVSRKYKSRATKIIKAGQELEVKELTADEVDFYNSGLCRLFSSVVNNQSFKLTPIAPDHFQQMKALYRDNFQVTAFFTGDTLVAFYSAIVNEKEYEIYYAGFDYSLNANYQLYFNILFSGLEKAILQKKKQLRLGRTSFDAKASLGAQPVPINYLVKTFHVPAAVTRWFVRYFSSLEDGKWKLRNPLGLKLPQHDAAAN